MRWPRRPPPASAAYLPHGAVVDLLRAALWEGEPARAAWSRGRQAYEGAPDIVEAAARWLEPLLAARLERLDVADPLRPRFDAARAAVGANAAHLFDHVAGLVHTLDVHGIQAMLVKGAALVGHDGADPSVRPMSDVDVLVRTSDARAAVQVAADSGWQARQPVTDNFLAIKHAAHFADADGCQLDLHWYAFEECTRPGTDDGMWGRSMAMDLRGAPARRPSSADALLHACIHGARWTRTPGVRWTTDAWSLMAQPDVDWRIVVDEAVRRRYVLRLRTTLGFMARALRAPVPNNVRAELLSYRPDITERLESSAAGYEQRVLGALPGYWFTYNRSADDKGLAALAGFPAYLGRAWNVESISDIGLAAARRARSRLASRS